MTVLIVCLFFSMLMPYLSKLPVAYAMQKAGGYDNAYPREQQARLQGFGARAVAAHQNSFESLLVFSIAALTALVTDHTSVTMQGLAIVYVISRVVYHLFYLMNWASWRSAIWFIGLGCCMVMMGLIILA